MALARVSPLPALSVTQKFSATRTKSHSRGKKNLNHNFPLQSQKCFWLETGKMDEQDFSVRVWEVQLPFEVNWLHLFFFVKWWRSMGTGSIVLASCTVQHPPSGFVWLEKKISGSQGRSVLGSFISHWGLLALGHHRVPTCPAKALWENYYPIIITQLLAEG